MIKISFPELKSNFSEESCPVGTEGQEMGVRVYIPPFMRYLANDVKVAEVNCGTLGECLNDLVGQFPSLREKIFDGEGKLLKPVDIYLNGTSSFPDELQKPVADGDEIHIVIIAAGG